MVYALGVLLVFQLGGEVLGRLLGLPVPGPVLGMVGLVMAFVMALVVAVAGRVAGGGARGAAFGRVVAEVVGGGSYLSQSDAACLFARPAGKTAELSIRWPDGTEQTAEVAAGDHHFVIEKK